MSYQVAPTPFTFTLSHPQEASDVSAIESFLGAFAKSDYWLCYVLLSVRMEQLDFHWTDFG
jgi:hypothetical protein